MTANTVLLLVFLGALPSYAQDTAKPQTQPPATCLFPGGGTMSLAPSAIGKTYRLVASDELVTIKGINVPAGDYTVLPAKDSHDSWVLTMRSESGGGAELPPVPMYVVATNGLPGGSAAVFFARKGASCTMHWLPENLKVLLSLEFRQKNADVPVMQ